MTDTDKQIEDLRKALFYINDEIEGMTEETAQRLNNILGQFSETLENIKNNNYGTN